MAVSALFPFLGNVLGVEGAGAVRIGFISVDGSLEGLLEVCYTFDLECCPKVHMPKAWSPA